jgi:hypothetical protein
MLRCLGEILRPVEKSLMSDMRSCNGFGKCAPWSVFHNVSLSFQH